MPGAAIRTQTTSCPAASRAVTAAPGKFSLARKRISGCVREYPLRAQYIARIGKTRDDVIVSNPRVIPEDIGLAPSVGHQPDREFDRQPCPTDDRLADEHVGGERNARMLDHGRLDTPLASAMSLLKVEASLAQKFSAEDRACILIISSVAKLPNIPGLKVEGSRVLPQPQAQGRRNPDFYNVMVEIDASIVGESATYVFNCIRNGQLTVVQPMGIR